MRRNFVLSKDWMVVVTIQTWSPCRPLSLRVAVVVFISTGNLFTDSIHITDHLDKKSTTQLLNSKILFSQILHSLWIGKKMDLYRVVCHYSGRFSVQFTKEAWFKLNLPQNSICSLFGLYPSRDDIENVGSVFRFQAVCPTKGILDGLVRMSYFWSDWIPLTTIPIMNCSFLSVLLSHLFSVSSEPWNDCLLFTWL